MPENLKRGEEIGDIEIPGSGGLGLEAEDVFYALDELAISNEEKWDLMRELAGNFIFGLTPEQLYENIVEVFNSYDIDVKEMDLFIKSLQFNNCSYSSCEELLKLHEALSKL